ncbi:hypothetical protein [Marinibacterium profundimaris]|uniref:Uncharacterized protein n=1 Tax=Marinibacterium profundimaris TaxID=1679460 RepID=A0A225NDW8_9RHOB|nr:hypothetical protein [Marinibacterium profundimaris]OWU70510.1 hypothetical protein ATO3_19785 [Marinibacterium profundimaris]
MTIDRAELFRLAWAWAKQDLWSRRLPASHLRGLFREALKRAWADLKRTAARLAAQRKTTAATRPAAQIQTDILVLECKDRLHGSDWQRLDALRAELMAAHAA